MYRNSQSPPQFPHPRAIEWGEDGYGLWQAFSYQEVVYRFRWIAPGSFDMGSPLGEKGRYNDEDKHKVIITKGLWLAETTVTQSLWQAVTEKDPSHFKGENLPVETVSFEDVQQFLQVLGREGVGLRLPTEAEWEYACRAGGQTAFSFGEELSLERVNYNGHWEKWDEFTDRAQKKTMPVKSYPCNSWGLYEMHGNVWEWCADAWQENLGHELCQNPLTESDEAAALRVVRGGSWYGEGRFARSAMRYGDSPDDRWDDLGFRLVLGH